MRSAAPARRPAMAYAALVRASIEALPPRDRIALAPKIWADCLAGRLSEAEAEALVTLAQGPAPAHRRPVVRVPKRPTPRSPDRQKSIHRRRTMAMSGAVPARIAAGFTTGECAVLAVLARQCQRLGRCTLCIDAIAAMAGVCRRLAQQAMRRAAMAGLIRVTERKVRAFRHLPHRIEIVSADWRTWLRLSPPQGCKFLHPTDNKKISWEEKARAKAMTGQDDRAPRPPGEPGRRGGIHGHRTGRT